MRSPASFRISTQQLKIALEELTRASAEVTGAYDGVSERAPEVYSGNSVHQNRY